MMREQPGQIGSLLEGNRRQEGGERGLVGRLSGWDDKKVLQMHGDDGGHEIVHLKVINVTDFCVVYFTIIKN